MNKPLWFPRSPIMMLTCRTTWDWDTIHHNRDATDKPELERPRQRHVAPASSSHCPSRLSTRSISQASMSRCYGLYPAPKRDSPTYAARLVRAAAPPTQSAASASGDLPRVSASLATGWFTAPRAAPVRQLREYLSALESVPRAS